MTRPNSERLYALDALRAAMMLFGVVMHAGLSYDGASPTHVWGICDNHPTRVADWLQAASRAFRMPAFFVVAGFFGALLEARHGFRGLIKNRATRIAGPFVVLWFVTFTLLRLAFVFAENTESQWTSAANAVRHGTLWRRPSPIHLWFLEYLIIFYVCSGPLAWAVRKIPHWLKGQWTHKYAAAIGGWWTPVVLALLTFPALVLSPHAGFGVPLSFRPSASTLLSYGACFTFGWLLYFHRERLPSLARLGPRWLAAGVIVALIPSALESAGSAHLRPVLVAIHAPANPAITASSAAPAQESLDDALGLDGRNETSSTYAKTHGLFNAPINHVVRAALSSIATALLVTGLLGTFLRIFAQPNRTVRYLSDASYWLYLAHFPMVAWVSVLLLPVALPGVWKLSLTALITMLFLIALYEICIRKTFFGRWINGKPGAPPPWVAAKS